jgi:Spy/CpxP family protein refolding chaperone
MKTLKILTIVAITGLAGTMTLNASGNDCSEKRYEKLQKNPSNMHKRSIMKLVKRLDLTDEQKSTLRDARKAVRVERRAKRLHAKRFRSIKKFITVDGFDKAGYIEHAKTRAGIRATKRAQMLEQTFAVLTPEQRLELVDLLDKKQKKIVK